MVVVDTADATLICPKERCQDVKRVVVNWRRGGGKSGWSIEQWSARGGRIRFLRQAKGIRLSAFLYDRGGD